MPSARKVVLAYSGGLDTSVILKWLQEKIDLHLEGTTGAALPFAAPRAGCAFSTSAAAAARRRFCAHSYLDEEARAQIRKAVERAYAPYASPSCATPPAACWLVRGATLRARGSIRFAQFWACCAKPDRCRLSNGWNSGTL
jgi:hypothetical protein